ncbi:hypothetical protein LVD15_04690 [Fulvivirga maritima]|uniref:OmpP1/FadL family transporter n=1 Tax=Fulvivirga maritima TaxID=2904247 RepID=UPI001F30F2B5|nr:hypothetical protein [Fulvivirga maritima]UII27726.1 hypothetical protein LVD15_04690 [Fulvivirga maritima]
MKITKKLIFISMAQLCLVFITKAQDITTPLSINYYDAGNFAGTALSLSRTYNGGSARMQGLGGAQVALGGDISSASSNPAGLGFFNRSEFSFSPTFNVPSTSSNYLGMSTDDSRLNLNFANLGVVLNHSKGDLVQSKWRGGSFGISLNRMADFQQQITYEGSSYNSEYLRDKNGDFILDENDNKILSLDPTAPKDFIEYTVLNSDYSVNPDNEITFTNDLTDLAYRTYLIDIFNEGGDDFVDRDIYQTDGNGNLIEDQDGFYIPAYPEEGLETRQQESIKSRGGIYQVSLAYGGNYNDRIYFGGGLGILSLNREVEREYIEQPTQTTLRQLTLTDNYNQNGIGINATLGFIARPINTLLIGATYTTPSYYSIEQTQETTLSASYTGATSYRSEYEEHGFIYDNFNYNLRTPSRLSGGLTYFLGKRGFITGDFERVNYAGANLSGASDGVSFQLDNDDIDRLEATYNYRAGIELRFNTFRVRGGYSYFGDPISDNDIDESISQVSLGGGIRTQDYFIDLAVRRVINNEFGVSPYAGAPQALVENNRTAATISVGFFF